MRAKLTGAAPVTALEQLLDALAETLIDVSDEEIIAAAQELGMNPMMKGSAAFLGLRIPSTAEVGDFFARDVAQSLPELESKAKLRRWKSADVGERKH